MKKKQDTSNKIQISSNDQIINFKIFWNLKLVSCLFLVSCFLSLASLASPPVRIKDIAHILGARDNQLMGFGLVVGLKNTGDSQSTGFTKQAMANLLSKMGVTPQIDFKSRNVAAVMVTANLPAFVKPGQKIDVTVSSMGDATSLQGGTLLLTPLQGADSDIYAVAQGSVLTGQDNLIPNLPPIRYGNVNAGRIPEGALVEKEVPVSFADKGSISIVLNEPDFTTVDRVVAAINNSGMDASAEDAGTVKVAVYGTQDALKVVSKIENLTVVADTVAKIVINERTGTIVVGENVRISPVAVSCNSINVSVGPINLYAQRDAEEGSSYQNLTRVQTQTKMTRIDKSLKYVPQSTRLTDLVRALNAIKARPQDLIAILQAMKKVGAIKAQLEII